MRRKLALLVIGAGLLIWQGLSYKEYNDNLRRSGNWLPDKVGFGVYLFDAVRFSLFPNEVEKFQKDLNSGDPHKLAIAKSKADQGGLIYTIHGEEMHRFGKAEPWGLECHGKWEKFSQPYMPWKMASYVPIDWEKVAEFNRMIITMPDYPTPHLCKISTSVFAKSFGVQDDIEYFKNKTFLKDLGMTEEEYSVERLKIEKSNIYTASYFGHIGALKKFIEDPELISKRDSSGCTPLAYAMRGGHEEAISLLQQHGATDMRCTAAIMVP